MAEIFNTFDRQTEARFMASLEDHNKEAAEHIKKLMFTFDDLAEARQWRIADADAPGRQGEARNGAQGRERGHRRVFLANMSQRAGKMLMEDMEALGPVRLKMSTKPNRRSSTRPRSSPPSGEILIAKNNADEELVY